MQDNYRKEKYKRNPWVDQYPNTLIKDIKDRLKAIPFAGPTVCLVAESLAINQGVPDLIPGPTMRFFLKGNCSTVCRPTDWVLYVIFRFKLLFVTYD